jgi:hypothetical protein
MHDWNKIIQEKLGGWGSSAVETPLMKTKSKLMGLGAAYEYISGYNSAIQHIDEIIGKLKNVPAQSENMSLSETYDTIIESYINNLELYAKTSNNRKSRRTRRQAKRTRRQAKRTRRQAKRTRR